MFELAWAEIRSTRSPVPSSYQAALVMQIWTVTGKPTGPLVSSGGSLYPGSQEAEPGKEPRRHVLGNLWVLSVNMGVVCLPGSVYLLEVNCLDNYLYPSLAQLFSEECGGGLL